MLIDDVTISVHAGKGGAGSVHFRREKYIPKGGPDGGNGGNGGSVYFIGDRDITLLRQFRNKKYIKAKDGVPGAGRKKHGANADDLVIKIPYGTRITNTKTGEQFEIEPGKKILIAQGGIGGLGNDEFKSSTNQTPRYAEPGTPGVTKEFKLELQLIADVGFVGFPNAGKSSLLNELTNAQVKTANYPFTTLEANLGDMHGVILADIPGLIENAHKGKGLGHKFLKHVAKTKLLAYCISGESDNVLHDYQAVHRELKEFDPALARKSSLLLLTKSDLLSEKDLKTKMKQLQKASKLVFATSIHNSDQLHALQEALKSYI